MAWIFAVAASRVPALLMIAPPVIVVPDVMLTANALISPLINALAPKITLRPALNVIVPVVDETVALIVKSPTAAAFAPDVNEIATSPVTFAPMVNALPALKVMVPSVELIVPPDVVIKSPVLNEDASDTLIPALIGALIISPRPELIVTVPNAELIAASTVISLVAPTAVWMHKPLQLPA